MSMKPERRRPDRQRTTVPLQGTAHSTPAHLSSEAELALAYSLAWLGKVSAVRLTQSAVLRRALQCYAHSLAEQDPRVEYCRAVTASTAREPAAEELDAWELRLLSVPDEAPLPPFQCILRGHDWQQRREAFDARVEDSLQAIGVAA